VEYRKCKNTFQRYFALYRNVKIVGEILWWCIEIVALN
jgi:hypothetical protein